MVTVELPGGARARFTGRAEGDLGHSGEYVTEVAPQVAAWRSKVLDLPWTWLRQVHGEGVVVVEGPGEGAGTRADAAVTAVPGCALAVLTADCAPVAVASPEGVLGAVHVGWKGLEAGVLERTLEAMGALGASTFTAALGPCIGPECYEFGEDDLERIAARVAPEVRARTATDRPAFDLAAGVRAVLGREGVALCAVSRCTACSGTGRGRSADYFSWRARKERQRQAVVVWR